MLRPMDIDRSGDVWTYRPESHQDTAPRPRACRLHWSAGAGILLRYLARDPRRIVSGRATRKRSGAAAHAARTTPLSCGNKPGTNRKSKPKKSAGECYTVCVYRRAIYRACDRAFPHPMLAGVKECNLTSDQQVELRQWQDAHRWAPNQLRHTAATAIRREFGLEAAQVTLGHAQANVTQVYAERDFAKAANVARMIG